MRRDITDSPAMEDYHLPAKIKVQKTTRPDKPAKDFFQWMKYIYNLRNQKQRA